MNQTLLLIMRLLSNHLSLDIRPYHIRLLPVLVDAPQATVEAKSEESQPFCTEFLPGDNKNTKEKQQRQEKGKVSKINRNFVQIVILSLHQAPVSLKETIVTKNTASHTAFQRTSKTKKKQTKKQIKVCVQPS
jgi:hypothetical protein